VKKINSAIKKSEILTPIFTKRNGKPPRINVKAHVNFELFFAPTHYYFFFLSFSYFFFVSNTDIKT